MKVNESFNVLCLFLSIFILVYRSITEMYLCLLFKVLCLIEVSNEGLSEEELKGILHIDSGMWSPIFFAIASFIVDRAGLYRYIFSSVLNFEIPILIFHFGSIFLISSGVIWFAFPIQLWLRGSAWGNKWVLPEKTIRQAHVRTKVIQLFWRQISGKIERIGSLIRHSCLEGPVD